MTDTRIANLQPAELVWDDEGRPIASQYEDYYFSKLSGLEEARYVFLSHNDLLERWAVLEPGEVFTIGETGFGTGLNFLAVWQLWQEKAPSYARLHFISVEKHPLNKKDLKQSLSLWPELTPFAQALVSAYPAGNPRFHRITLSNTIALTLLFDDATTALSELHASIDAWFLDGFTPVKNPDMWTEELFLALAALSHKDTTFSTFTAASKVKKSLKSAGFSIKKASGFGKKREMIYGHYSGDNTSPPAKQTRTASNKTRQALGWFTLPQSNSTKKVTIIGAGIAGCSNARALAERGIKVTLLDKHPQIANEASGNQQGVLYAKLPAIPTKASRIHLAGLDFSLRLLASLDTRHWQACGVLQLATNANETDKQQKLINTQAYASSYVQAVNAEQASTLAGVDITHSGLWFPESGYVSPRDWCQQLVDHPLINVITDCEVSNLSYVDQQWQIQTTKNALTADTVVLCCADQAKLFSITQWLPTKSIRGQVSQVAPTAPSPEPQLNCVLCGNGYISPATEQGWNFGATFNLNDSEPKLRLEDHQTNLAHINELSSTLANAIEETPLTDWNGRVAFRCTSPDYLPIVGPVPQLDDFAERYQALRTNAKASIPEPPAYIPNCYINIAHGSKGMITAPLASELVASLICNETLPLEKELINALLPARFLVKKLIRKAI